jgi:PIN domain nuclease of toxin-antitoxin system
MNVLLDTHTFIWTLLDSKKLSSKVLKILKDDENQANLSTISLWEISIKIRMHRYSLEGIEPKYLPRYIKQLGYSVISLNEDEASTCNELPFYQDHKDPFDRMLVWQAIRRKLPIISRDEKFELYKDFGLRVVW